MESIPLWKDIILTITAAVPAAIAAISSLRNGHHLRKNGPPVPGPRGAIRPRQSPNKKAQRPDWYEPPELK